MQVEIIDGLTLAVEISEAKRLPLADGGGDRGVSLKMLGGAVGALESGVVPGQPG